MTWHTWKDVTYMYNLEFEPLNSIFVQKPRSKLKKRIGFRLSRYMSGDINDNQDLDIWLFSNKCVLRQYVGFECFALGVSRLSAV